MWRILKVHNLDLNKWKFYHVLMTLYSCTCSSHLYMSFINYSFVLIWKHFFTEFLGVIFKPCGHTFHSSACVHFMWAAELWRLQNSECHSWCLKPCLGGAPSTSSLASSVGVALAPASGSRAQFYSPIFSHNMLSNVIFKHIPQKKRHWERMAKNNVIWNTGLRWRNNLYFCAFCFLLHTISPWTLSMLTG